MFEPQTILSDSLAKSNIGGIEISLDSWTDNAICSITAGSWATVAGTVYYLTGGDITIDGDGTLAGAPNNALYYFYLDSVDKDVITSASAPAWLDDRSEWGATLGAGHYCRCLGSIYKNSLGTYERKHIANLGRNSFDFEMSYQKTKIIGELDCYATDDIGVEFKSLTTTKSVAGDDIKTYDFYLTKPITLWASMSHTGSGSGSNSTINLFLYQNGDWRATPVTCYTFGAGTGVMAYSYVSQLIAGKYRFYVKSNVVTSGSTTTVGKIFCTSVWGKSTITASGIIVDI